MMPSVLPILLLLEGLVHLSRSQFSPTDGTNDLFALFTQCPITPNYPPDNQFFCYRTNERVVSGFTFCQPVFVRERAISVADRTDTHTIFFANTPGRLRGANYVNRLLCRWNVKCSPGQLLYFDFPEHDIEDAVNSPFFVNPICIDYLKISRDFGDSFSCGTNAPSSDVEPNRLLVEFRSNRENREPGFRMRAICFNPTTQDSVGCTTTTPSGKRKRDTEDDFNKLLTQSDHDILDSMAVNRTKRNSITPDRFIQEDVDMVSKVVYYQFTVSVISRGKIILSFSDVNAFHSFNEFDGVSSFYGEILGNRTITLRGFGVLVITKNTAYYVVFGADPRFLPNAQEKQMIRQLLDAEEQLIADDDFIIREDTRSSTGHRHRHTHGRRSHRRRGHNHTRGRRATNDQQQPNSRAKRTNNFEPEIIAMAQSAQNSCNAILMAVAQSILNNL